MIQRAVNLIIVAAVVSSFASVTVARAPGVPDWAANLLSSWYTSFNRGDAAGVAMLFSEDARLGDLNGRAAIQKALSDQFQKTRYRCAGRYDGIEVLGDLAVAWGGETCLATTRPEGKTSSTKERWLLVFERTAPNQWLLTRETYEAIE